MFKMAMEMQSVKEELAEVMKNIDVFEFEERKHVQHFITELFNQFKEVVEDALDLHKEEVVTALVDKYDAPGMSAFIGNLLRLYTKSSKLIGAF